MSGRCKTIGVKPDRNCRKTFQNYFTFLTSRLLDPGVRFGTAQSPILLTSGSSSSTISFDIATLDGTARIEDFSFEAIGLNLINGGTGTADPVLTSGATVLADLVLDSGTTSDSTSFTAVSSAHLVLTLEGTWAW